MREIIYADHNATTPLGQGAISRMARAFEVWGNPSSAHAVGREAQEFMEESRRLIAERVGVEPGEIVFTSGGSEANTLALWGSSLVHEGFRLLTTRVEHSSVRDTAGLLQARGARVEYCKVGLSGTVDLAEFERQIEDLKPHLVSIMTANNETGVLFPTAEMAGLCKARGIVFHTDAVQALGKVALSVWKDADLISLSAHKIYGPKGAGALVVKRGKKLISTHYGGSQEVKRRGGTENTVGIAGFGGACTELPVEPGADLAQLRDRFEQQLLASLENTTVIAASSPRIGNTSSVRFGGIANEVLLSALDLGGVCISAGSACSSGSISPSHVLLEMGFSPTEAKECLRFSWGRSTTSAHIDTVATLVIEHVKRIRSRRKPS